MHNLGVVYTEQGLWLEAENLFMAAYEQQSKENKVSYTTIWGLATVMTEQGDMPKLLQAEALYRDFLVYAVGKKQKGWSYVVEVREAALTLAEPMFGEESERTQVHRAALARALKLSRWQRRFRYVS